MLRRSTHGNNENYSKGVALTTNDGPFYTMIVLGAALDFKTIIKAGAPGLLLGFMVVILTGLAGYYTYSLFGVKKAVGAAIGTTDGSAVATPSAIAAADPRLADMEIVSKVKVSGLFLTGGDTAIGVIKNLGSGGSKILSELLPGIPLMSLKGGNWDGLKAVTKAGAFGKEDSIDYCIKRLKEKC
nr:putative sulfate exporter family transporter [Fonticella tunisiensis]